MSAKQVLIWRADLRNEKGHKVRTGKVAAQLAHASMKAILSEGSVLINDGGKEVLTIPLTPEMSEWIQGIFTKICVSVDSEGELLDTYQQAKNKNLHCSLIQDAGLTEFGGEPTYTAVAVGPGDPDEINKITGHLKLL